ncbi:MAG: heterodisulfide reductase subunit B [Chloroflexi bacterium]|nr:heterodisulfide reductase subunit B [Chloroflexota bacterium]
MKFAYYPGCSLHATGLEYDQSTRAALCALDVELDELRDWNCCGASSAHALDANAAILLAARNLALAQRAHRDVIAPCAACFNRLKVAEHILKTDSTRRVEIERALDFYYADATQILNPIDLVVNHIGLPRVRAAVKNPLTDLRVVPHITQFDDPEHPRALDQLLSAIGAQPCEWADATHCCGGSLSLTRANIVIKLVDDLVAHARDVNAQAIVTACPLCQINLEMRQTRADKLPIVYFTELMGLAFGLKESRKWWGKHLINPRELVSRYQ